MTVVQYNHYSLERGIASAEYGTNDNAGPPSRPESPPESTDTVLVSRTWYNVRGEAFETVDAAGIVTHTELDQAGRLVRTISNFMPEANGCYQAGSERNVVVERQYNQAGQLAALIAKNPVTGDQVTRYQYGVNRATSDIVSNDLLAAEVYPDSADSADAVRYSYNRQGQMKSLTDQNGNVHQYTFDGLGRQTADRITTLGDGVDGAVRRIERSYEVRGLVEKVTSYDAASGGNVVNQVQNVYNGFAQLITQYQEHDGSVNTSNTPKVQYGYANGAANTIRPTSMTYPNARVLNYGYDSTAANKLSRIRTLEWDGTDVCRYSYLGLNTFVTTDYLEPQVKLDYALGSGVNPYDDEVCTLASDYLEFLWKNTKPGVIQEPGVNM